MGLPGLALGYVCGYALPRMPRTLAQNVAELRELKRLSQGEANRAAGFNDNRFSTIERGTVQDPQLSTVLGLAVGLRARLDEVVQGLNEDYDAIAAGGASPTDLDATGGHADMLRNPDVSAIVNLIAGTDASLRDAAISALLGLAMEWRSKRPPGFREESSSGRSLP